MKLITGMILSMFVTILALSQDKGLTPAQAELVNAERSFAKLAVERGVRDSFIAYFAEDGIGFRPQPYLVKETLSKQAPPAERSPIVLNWAPVLGDIAQAGDMGWNTGPTVFEDAGPARKPTRHGQFFSVWKKQSDGSWKVVVDLGADTPSAIAPLDAPFKSYFRPSSKQPPAVVNVEEEIAGLLKTEREFYAAGKSGTLRYALQSRLSDEARIHRPGLMPVTGKTALAAWLEQQNMPFGGEPIKADVSRSGDLGYAYGSYELGGARPEKGHYVRVWKKDEKGQWRIVIDVISPLPVKELSPEALASKALTHYQAQEWKEAAESYQQYIKLNPNDAAAWHRLGTSQIFLKQYPEAIKNLEQAIKVGGGVALDYYNLACALAMSGQKDKALDNLEKAVNGGFTDRQQYETDTDLDGLREMERFKQLLKRLP